MEAFIGLLRKGGEKKIRQEEKLLPEGMAEET